MQTSNIQRTSKSCLWGFRVEGLGCCVLGTIPEPGCGEMLVIPKLEIRPYWYNFSMELII